MDMRQTEIEQLRLKCIACGKCTKVCPSNRHGGCDPMEIMTGSDDMIQSCISCGNCSRVCRRTDPFRAIQDMISLANDIHVSQTFKDTGYAQPVAEPAERLEPVWDGDDVRVMPGCIVKCKLQYVEYAASVAMKAMGIGSRELPNSTCCMHPLQFREMMEQERRAYKLDMGKNAEGRRIVTLCAGCSEELHETGVDAEHIIPFLHENLDRLPRSEDAVKVALEPGCSAMQFLKQMADVVTAMGFEYIGNRTGCCGKNVDVSVPLMEEREEECKDADLIVVGCPMCLIKYDSQPDGKPVVHIAELVAMATGDRSTLDLHKIRF